MVRVTSKRGTVEDGWGCDCGNAAAEGTLLALVMVTYTELDLPG